MSQMKDALVKANITSVRKLLEVDSPKVVNLRKNTAYINISALTKPQAYMALFNYQRSVYEQISIFQAIDVVEDFIFEGRVLLGKAPALVFETDKGCTIDISGDMMEVTSFDNFHGKEAAICAITTMIDSLREME